MKNFSQHLDTNKAKSEYIKISDNYTLHNFLLTFSNYSPSYIVTNEDIRWVSGLTKSLGHSVLTVAGSGDQPIFYALNGAKDIDTFDISFCSKATMDIKTAAIKKLSRTEYIKMLFDMYDSTKISSIPSVSKLFEHIPQDSKFFVKEMDEMPIFSNGLPPKDYKYILPTEDEYIKMRSNVPTQFNFIWADLNNLHKHLTKKYDVINLSNILEYMNIQQANDIIASLRNHVQKNGYIIAQTCSCDADIKQEIFYEAANRFKKWAKVGYIKKDYKKPNSDIVAIVQKVR